MAPQPVQGTSTHGNTTPRQMLSDEAAGQSTASTGTSSEAYSASGNAPASPSGSSIQVAARVRPLSETELSSAAETSLVVDPAYGLVRVDGASVYYKQERSFALHKVFGPETTQSNIFDACVSPLVDDVLLGYNVCVFAYGQTGSGKTYTMEGPTKPVMTERPQRRSMVAGDDVTPTRVLRRSNSDTLGPSAKLALREAIRASGESFSTSLHTSVDAGSSHWSDDEPPAGDHELTENLGFVQRSIHAIFERLERRHKGFYEVSCSHLELYNEEMHDLMSVQEDSAGGRRSSSLTNRRLSAFGSSVSLPAHMSLRLEEDGNGRVRCAGLTEMPCTDIASAISAIKRSSAARATKATLSNERSSRSHSILSFNIMVKNGIDERGCTVERYGQLSLVDLAGSENSKRSGAQGAAAREAATINQSLLTLGRVITALVNNHPHVPYRDSKLTRLLQDSLGGSSKTLIVATVSPLRAHLDETISTLSYAVNAASIVNAPKRNMRTSVNDRIRLLTEENRRLRELLDAAQEQHGEYCERGTLQAMEAELAELRDFKVLMQQKLAIADERVAVLTQQLAAKDRRLDAQQSAEAAAQRAAASAASDLSSELAAFHEHLRHTEAQTAEVSSAIDEMQAEDVNLRTDLLDSFGHLLNDSDGLEPSQIAETSGASFARVVTHEMNSRLERCAKDMRDLHDEFLAATSGAAECQAGLAESLRAAEQRLEEEEQTAAARHSVLEAKSRDLQAQAAADATEAAEAMRLALVAHREREASLIQECAALRDSASEASEQARLAHGDFLANRAVTENETRWLERQVSAAIAEFSRRVAPQVHEERMPRGQLSSTSVSLPIQHVAEELTAEGAAEFVSESPVSEIPVAGCPSDMLVAESPSRRPSSELVHRSEELLSGSPLIDDVSAEPQDTSEQPFAAPGVSWQRVRRITRRKSDRRPAASSAAVAEELAGDKPEARTESVDENLAEELLGL